MDQRVKMKKIWSFVHVADMHVGTPRSYRFQPAWNENWITARTQILALKPEFMVIGGDLTRDGATHRFELEQMKTDLDALPFPCHVIPGNHEVGNKYDPNSSVSIRSDYIRLYRSVFKESHWSFIYRGIRFSGFDALLAGSGLPEEEEMWGWLEEQWNQAPARRHVWFIHPALFVNTLDEPNWAPSKDREAWYFTLDDPHRSRIWRIFRATSTTLVISAHIHCRRQLRVDGITIQFAPATAFPQWSDRWPDGDASLGFLHCLVTEDGIEPRFIPLKNVSSKKGYGPGGNPPLEGRDYSLAWQKPPLNPEEQRFPKSAKN